MNVQNIIGQNSSEQIIKIIRRHWFNIAYHMFVIFLMVLMLFASFVYLPILFPAFNTSLMHSLFLFAENSFAMIIWILFFILWIDYYFDVWVITNKRVINIEQKGLFSRDVSEVSLEKIQDITTNVTGILSTMMDFGDVQIQTAAEQEKFLFRRVPDPYGIKDIIVRLGKQKEQESTEQLKNILQKDSV